VPNTIVTSFNRNFPRRNDGSSNTKAFLASPELVLAYALAGTLDFNPRCDDIDGVRLEPPVGDALPAEGYASRGHRALIGAGSRTDIEITVSPSSDRLQLLEPFASWDGNDYVDLPVLFKAVGRCTTDHISAAGPWLRYRGHLENICGNLFAGVVNAYANEAGRGIDPLDGTNSPLPDIAEHLAREKVRWCAVGDANYGEGSSREHAAMEPRHRGGVVILARSFARIHETNLKKQGILPLQFEDPTIYDVIEHDDRISVLGLRHLSAGAVVHCRLTKPVGTMVDFTCSHTLSERQIEWFRQGSALNVVRARRHARADPIKPV
jgi:aconitate hydratase